MNKPDKTLHLTALGDCLDRTTGRVLELGAGIHSTPFLHRRCQRRGRTLWTLDNNAGYLVRFRYLARPWHHLDVVRDWVTDPRVADLWDVALVDQAPADARVPTLARLAWTARFIVIHDTNIDEYGFDRAWPLFKYRRDYNSTTPWATVVSNYEQP